MNVITYVHIYLLHKGEGALMSVTMEDVIVRDSAVQHASKTCILYDIVHTC